MASRRHRDSSPAWSSALRRRPGGERVPRRRALGGGPRGPALQGGQAHLRQPHLARRDQRVAVGADRPGAAVPAVVERHRTRGRPGGARVLQQLHFYFYLSKTI